MTKYRYVLSDKKEGNISVSWKDQKGNDFVAVLMPFDFIDSKDLEKLRKQVKPKLGQWLRRIDDIASGQTDSLSIGLLTNLASRVFPREMATQFGGKTVEVNELASALAREIRAFFDKECKKEQDAERKRISRDREKYGRRNWVPAQYIDQRLYYTPRRLDDWFDSRDWANAINAKTEKEIGKLNQDLVDSIKAGYFFGLSKQSPRFLEGACFYAGLMRSKEKGVTLANRPGRHVSRWWESGKDQDTGEAEEVEFLRVRDTMAGFFEAMQCKTRSRRQQLMDDLRSGVFNQMILTNFEFGKSDLRVMRMAESTTNRIYFKVMESQKTLPGMRNLQNVDSFETNAGIELRIPAGWIFPILETKESAIKESGGQYFEKPEFIIEMLENAIEKNKEALQDLYKQHGFKRVTPTWNDDIYTVFYWLLYQTPQFNDKKTGKKKGCDTFTAQDGKQWMTAFLNYKYYARISSVQHYENRNGRAVIKIWQIKEYLSHCLEVIKYAGQDAEKGKYGHIAIKDYDLDATSPIDNNPAVRITFRNIRNQQEEAKALRKARNKKRKRSQ